MFQAAKREENIGTRNKQICVETKINLLEDALEFMKKHGSTTACLFSGLIKNQPLNGCSFAGIL